jgi:hypothetical protein
LGSRSCQHNTAAATSSDDDETFAQKLTPNHKKGSKAAKGVTVRGPTKARQLQTAMHTPQAALDELKRREEQTGVLPHTHRCTDIVR